MKLQQAYDIAFKICTKLQPHCQERKVKIAGSIRRKIEDVKDVEIVCLPRLIVTEKTLFGEESQTKDPKFAEIINGLGTIIKGKPDGKMMQIHLPEQIMLDLFIPSENDYYRQYAIRTGSRDYSHFVIATGWNKIGWVGTKPDGLRKETDCKPYFYEVNGQRKKSWKCVNPEPELPPIWQSEKEFFEWIQVPWIAPELRNFKPQLNYSQ